ncbi:MAG: helix-turn-helix domain-containing protein [Anaerolineae bacterium]
MTEERPKIGHVYTTSELAELGNVDQSRIRQLLGDGTLKGEKRGRDWLIYGWSGDRWLAERENEQDAG